MAYNYVSIVVEDKDRKEIKRVLCDVLGRMQSKWYSYFSEMKGSGSLFLTTGYEYYILTEAKGGKSVLEEEPLLLVGRLDLGSVRLVYPYEVNLRFIERAREGLDLHEEHVLSAMLVGLGRAVLPVEGCYVVLLLDWDELFFRKFQHLYEVIDGCFSGDMVSECRGFFKGFENERFNPVLYYLQRKTKSEAVYRSILGLLREEGFDVGRKGMVVKWGFDSEVYVNVKLQVSETDQAILESFSMELKGWRIGDAKENETKRARVVFEKS